MQLVHSRVCVLLTARNPQPAEDVYLFRRYFVLAALASGQVCVHE